MRGWDGDQRTVVGDAQVLQVGYRELQALFDMHFDSVRRAQLRVRDPGVLCLAFDLGSARLASKHWFKTRSSGINAIAIGRHSKCDLCLPRDPTLSLRHLLLVVEPFSEKTEERIRFRALDLHTPLGFRDCFGHQLQAVVADGPTTLTLGRYMLLILPTGCAPLPRDRRLAWDVVADPLYLEQHTLMQSAAPRIARVGEPDLEDAAGCAALDADAHEAVPDEGPPDEAPEDAAQRTSFTIISGPRRPSRALVSPGEPLLGVLEVSTPVASRHIEIGRAAADNGLLLGCYDRCDDACLAHVSDPAISRVHLVLLSQPTGVYAIDTASTNGTFAEQPDRKVRVRIAKLSESFDVLLADGRARLHWEPASP